MNSYELSRKWFDWCFDNASKIKPIHTALFFFMIEHNNRLGWKKEFGLPRDMAMDAIGVKNNRTYSGAFNDLEQWKFIDVVERSKNQYSANIISLFACVKNTPATTSALDEAMLKHLHKQSIGIAPIDKHNNIITSKQETGDVELIKTTKEMKQIDVVYTVVEFLKDWNKQRTEHLKKPSFLNRLNHDDLLNFNDLAKDYKGNDFNYALIGLFKQKKLPNGNTSMQSNPKHFLTHFNAYLTAFHDKNNGLYGKQENIQTL